MLKTPTEIREELERNGLSLAAWARQNGFSEALTYRVMRGHKTKLGQSHRIAVALGLKNGFSADISELDFKVHSSQMESDG